MSAKFHFTWQALAKRVSTIYRTTYRRFDVTGWPLREFPSWRIVPERRFSSGIGKERMKEFNMPTKSPHRTTEPQPIEDRSSRSNITVEGSSPNESRKFELLYLRDCCNCDRCVDVSTSQKLFETAEIPPNITCEAVRKLDDGGVQITWANDIPSYDKHVSMFSATALKSMDTTGDALLPKRRCWNRTDLFDCTLSFEYDHFLSSDETLLDALIQLQRSGLVFLQSIPSEESASKKIAARIGPLRNTFYGPTWDVKSVPSAKNVAYTSQKLGFHMDLLYMADPPGLQILHTLKACAHGGESLFSDGLRVIHQMYKHHREDYQVLTDHFVTYRYKNDGHWYEFSRPVIDGEFSFSSSGVEMKNPRDGEGEINWGPPFQGPFIHYPASNGTFQSPTAHHGLSDYVRAAKIFKTYLESAEAVFETKMGAGTCVIFDNRRILHARKAFRNDSERWLKGLYVDKDPFRSRLRTLIEEHDPTRRNITSRD